MNAEHQDQCLQLSILHQMICRLSHTALPVHFIPDLLIDVHFKKGEFRFKNRNKGLFVLVIPLTCMKATRGEICLQVRLGVTIPSRVE